MPKKWRDYPAPSRLAKIGSDWVVSNETLLLRVPSAIVKDEFNILLNPAHGDMKRVKIANVEKYKLDERLFKQMHDQIQKLKCERSQALKIKIKIQMSNKLKSNRPK